MKNIYIFSFFLFQLGYSQAQQCSTVYFNYGATGHRTQRLFETCDPLDNIKTDSTALLNRNKLKLFTNVFPNPLEDILNIEIPKVELPNFEVVSTFIKLCDLTGREIYSEITELDHVKINTSGFSPGMYLLTIVNGNKNSTQSVIKK
jgi:hypothetical protein